MKRTFPIHDPEARTIEFAVRHRDSDAQEDILEDLKQRGCAVVFVNWVTGETTFTAPEWVAESIREWLFRVMTMYDGKDFTKKRMRDPNINRVKRMEYSPQEFYTPTYLGGVEMVTQKYTWMCRTCGRVWRFRSDAQYCKHEDTVWKRGKTYRCIRREQI